ncbi:nucleotide diphosphatase [Acetobacter nitrogenifigens DSM 23921 = NBRC 105050]|uniref:Alkaline phosphatase family protein n=1 Tax=Acetobacter nitrogenifigens DSM 23921 = NBRC 105050 TaxID=1120919 RepID=A0A511XEI9_9PROT|nr:ectonucleotide pyrophosphatase/phosphodiesterase [Acetobacter nitrogenifigens]GBQ99545.1 nucleotide diphosphatase [Acetobacter nitrogenifigens DSM 23921 = NBRC 105050]GEN61354.1 alkaline phosphatase family protein [Acetobacter nitrogenifigens DSM 23921 = NBRC 105050]
MKRPLSKTLDTSRLKRLGLSGAIVLLLAACAHDATQSAQGPQPTPVILVSIDGFRPDYLKRDVTPNLNALAASGVLADGMRPSYPSITFPNHYTLVTGRRPDETGVVGNTMDDPAIANEHFSLGNRTALIDRRWWDEAEPIWVTAEKQGVRSSTLFWPGSEADIHGVRPSDWLPFNSKMSSNDRVDHLLGWFDRTPDKRPRFATLYFDIVDHSGHENGPNAPETTQAAATVDTAIGRLVEGLKSRGIKADIIVVSDHGMAAISDRRVIHVESLSPAKTFHMVVGGAYAGIDPTPGNEAVLAANLTKKHAHVVCWAKADIPERLHYGHNARVPAFVCMPNDGWVIEAGKWKPHNPNGGDHGYDNQEPDMTATFLASGPAFQPGTHIATFDNVDVYPLVMTLLGLKPLPSDGTIAPFTPVLKQGASTGTPAASH